LLFFSSWFERGDKRQIPTVELTQILFTKIVDLGVNKFHLVKGVVLVCFFTLKLPKKLDLNSKKVFFYFLFQVVLGLCMLFKGNLWGC